MKSNKGLSDKNMGKTYGLSSVGKLANISER